MGVIIRSLGTSYCGLLDWEGRFVRNATFIFRTHTPIVFSRWRQRVSPESRYKFPKIYTVPEHDHDLHVRGSKIANDAVLHTQTKGRTRKTGLLHQLTHCLETWKE
jgi:hypothetical protein